MRMLARIRSVPVDGGPISAILGGADDTGASPPVVGRVRGILAQARRHRSDATPCRRSAATRPPGSSSRRPPYDGPWVLVHGDYKVGNFVWRGNEIATVLDWELAAIGDPLEDLGLRLPPGHALAGAGAHGDAGAVRSAAAPARVGDPGAWPSTCSGSTTT